MGYTELYKGCIQTSLKGGWVLVYLQSDSTHQTWIQWVFSFRSHLKCHMVFNLPSMHVKLASWLAHLPNCISVQAPWKSAWNQPVLSHPITNTIDPKFLYKGKSNFRSSKCRLGREDWGSCLLTDCVPICHFQGQEEQHRCSHTWDDQFNWAIVASVTPMLQGGFKPGGLVSAFVIYQPGPSIRFSSYFPYQAGFGIRHFHKTFIPVWS